MNPFIERINKRKKLEHNVTNGENKENVNKENVDNDDNLEQEMNTKLSSINREIEDRKIQIYLVNEYMKNLAMVINNTYIQDTIVRYDVNSVQVSFAYNHKNTTYRDCEDLYNEDELYNIRFQFDYEKNNLYVIDDKLHQELILILENIELRQLGSRKNIQPCLDFLKKVKMYMKMYNIMTKINDHFYSKKRDIALIFDDSMYSFYIEYINKNKYRLYFDITKNDYRILYSNEEDFLKTTKDKTQDDDNFICNLKLESEIDITNKLFKVILMFVSQMLKNKRR